VGSPTSSLRDLSSGDRDALWAAPPRHRLRGWFTHAQSRPESGLQLALRLTLDSASAVLLFVRASMTDERVHEGTTWLTFTLLLAWGAVGARAQSSSSSSSSSAGSSNGTDAGDETQAELLAQDWFEANSDENVTYLAVGVNSALSNITAGEVICGEGVPSLQRRTTHHLPNDGCPALFTALNGSCTCLPDYSGQDSWEFFVAKRTTESEYPLTLNDTDVLPIDSVRTLLVPSHVVSLCVASSLRLAGRAGEAHWCLVWFSQVDHRRGRRASGHHVCASRRGSARLRRSCCREWRREQLRHRHNRSVRATDACVCSSADCELVLCCSDDSRTSTCRPSS
jgi:hypothetical protein